MDLPSPYAGFDRHNMTDGVSEPAQWLDELHRRSNFDFLGVYLKDSSVPDPNRILELTASARAGDNGYKKMFPELEKQGWGMCYFYLGYSFRVSHPWLGPKELIKKIFVMENGKMKEKTVWKDDVGPLHPKNVAKLFPEALAIERGIVHAKHVKLILSSWKPDTRGAVIYLDDEGCWADMWKVFISYYKSFFLELQRPGKANEPEAVRPGIYAIKNDLRQLLKQEGLEDLFVWHLDYHHRGTLAWTKTFEQRQSVRPYRKTPGRVFMDTKDFPVTNIDNLKRSSSSKGSTALSVGRQALLNETYKLRYEDYFDKNDKPKRTWTEEQVEMEKDNAAIWLPGRTKTNANLVPVRGFDLDISMVRDPRYPEANPRIQMNGATILRGDYRKVVGSSNPEDLPDLVSTLVVRDAQHVDGRPIEESLVEPEAPISMPTSDSFFTITKLGEIAYSTRSDGAWSPLTPIPASPGQPLRRLRAMCSISAGNFGLHVFYISTDRQIQARRQLGGGGWTSPVALANGIEAHPFSNLTCSFFAGDTVWVYFVNVGGALETISFKVTASNWSDTKHFAPPGPPPASYILPGTAITCVSPSPAVQLVFTVGRDLRLRMLVYMGNIKQWSWLPVKSAGLLFAHTRLASISTDPKKVLVAALTSEGLPAIYTLRDTAKGGWMAGSERKESPRVVSPLIPPAATDKIASSVKWHVNPFSDLVFGRKDGKLILLCAGAAPGKSELLALGVDTP